MSIPDFDHAASRAAKQLQGLQERSVSRLVSFQTCTVSYLGDNEGSPEAGVSLRTYHSNNSIWEDVLLTKSLRLGSRLSLEGFFLFEWFPLSPGLYYTEAGRAAREEAHSHIRKLENDVIVYDPYGKMAMVEGGIGNIRLNPIGVDGPREFVFMSASSNGTSHEGFPVALPFQLYNKVIDEIRAKGAAVCTLTGVLKQVPKELVDLYHGYTGVPKLYLCIEDVQKPRHPKSTRLEEFSVTVVASFSSDYEGEGRAYACYVTFDPRSPQDLVHKVRWLEDEYVKGAYRGAVITDFDEQENHFPDARFRLGKVMNFKIQNEDFLAVRDLILIDHAEINQIMTAQANIKEMYMAKYVNRGKVGAMGDGAQSIQVGETGHQRHEQSEAPPDPRPQGPRAWEKIAAVIFGVVFVSVLLAVAIFIPHPTGFQIFVFRIVLALAAAGLGAVIPGFISVQAGPYIKAGGALALFAIVYAFNPPQLLVNTDPSDNGHAPIDVSLKLTPEFVPKNKKQVWVRATMTNNGARQVSIAMIGLRIWRSWTTDTTVQTSPDSLIFSDTRVKDCPQDICPKQSSRSFLMPIDLGIVLPDGGHPYEQKFGPYNIPSDISQNGFWLEGWAFPREQDEGTCEVAGPPIVEGAFPQFCDSRKIGERDCYKLKGCKVAYSASSFFSLPK